MSDESPHRSGQQEETFRYFDGYARSWRDEANTSGYSAIVNRRLIAHHAAMLSRKSLRVLDLGSGTGELCVELAEAGHECTGVDFAPEMIRLSEELATQRSTNVNFECSSFFELESSPDSYDLITALGFIEYIGISDLDLFMERCHKWLRPNARLVVGSRNRLFNLTSLNAYTEMELELETVSGLTREAVVCASANSQADLLSGLRKMNSSFPEALRHPILDPSRQIRVQTRHQYTPAELLARLEKYRFEVEFIAPVNVHAVHPTALRLEESFRSEYDALGLRLQNERTIDGRFLPLASSFVTVARKTN